MYIFGTDLDDVIADLESLVKHEHIKELEKTELTRQLLAVLLPPIYERLPVVPGAKENLLRIKEIPAKIVIVTARFDADERITREWLEREMIPYDEIHFVGRFKDKSITYYDWFVDDIPENLLTLQAKRKFLFNRPWNKNSEIGTRVYSWDEIYIYIKEDLQTWNAR